MLLYLLQVTLFYRAPLSDATSRQGNLTLGVNRHRRYDDDDDDEDPIALIATPRSSNLGWGLWFTQTMVINVLSNLLELHL